MKIIKINSSNTTVSKLHNVEVPAQFSSESERTELLNKVLDLRDDDKLTGAQAKELRAKIMATAVVANSDSTVKREYAINSEMLFGKFNENVGDAVKGTASKDLPKEWNKAGSYDDTGIGSFQVSTGAQTMVFFGIKDMDSTIFNGSNKRAGNNIKSSICTFQNNQNQDAPKFLQKDSKMEIAEEARKMYLEGMDKLLPAIKEFYEKLASLNIEPITLENVQKRLDAKKNAIADAGKAKAMKVIETEASEQGLTTEDYILVQASQNGYDSPEAYIASRIAA